MIKRRALLLLALATALPVAPAAANSAARGALPGKQQATPSVLNPTEREQYRRIFAAIRSGDWASAAAGLDATGDGPLHAAARAQLYTAKGSPVVSLEQLQTLLAAAPDLPQAEQLGRLALRRGATELPQLPQAQRLIWQDGQPRRARARSTSGDPAASALDAIVQPLIVDDRPSEAEAQLIAVQDQLSPAARTEFQQRIAWSYYITGRDADARRLSDMARSGSGEWAMQGAWVSGLAAWRQGDCNAAADAFATVGARASDPELLAAGNYWAARADMMCGRPERVQARLRTAARLNETFYGLLSISALGVSDRGFSGLHNFRDAEWRKIADQRNVKTAIALAEIDEDALAGEFIRHQARLGGAREHEALIHLASDLNLASTQYWLAHNVPQGARVNTAARYPMPDWKPEGGWRVDRSLAFAHALQESSFRTEVVSPAGAVGLMQVRPGTAGDMARNRGAAFSQDQLRRPGSNLEYGQSYLEYLRGHYSTGGLLPKVIAAYNAGPAPVAEWNTRKMDGGDPLLYIESIPYWETRGYVPIVLRNYWMYEGRADQKDSPSRKALAEGQWPRFPGLPGPTSVRLANNDSGSAGRSGGSD
jgi:soluble lytic murein transglycosylase